MSRYVEYYDAAPYGAQYSPPSSDDLIQGDIVAVNVQGQGRREGTVIGSHQDQQGRQIVEIMFEAGDYVRAWQSHVTRVRRVTHYRHTPPATRTKTVERYIYW